MGLLTTHVLDTAKGQPARGLRVELFRLERDRPIKIAETITNPDGRCDTPLVEGVDLVSGIYELRFHAGSYLDTGGPSAPEPKFLDCIVIRFGIADPKQHYHVPLLLSPYGYSTYRGS